MQQSKSSDDACETTMKRLETIEEESEDVASEVVRDEPNFREGVPPFGGPTDRGQGSEDPDAISVQPADTFPFLYLGKVSNSTEK